VGLERARRRREAGGEAVADRFEAETVQFFERVRASYLQIARRNPRRCRVLDATRPPAEVCAAATQALAELDA
jgi:dTMP kinase